MKLGIVTAVLIAGVISPIIATLNQNYSKRSGPIPKKAQEHTSNSLSIARINNTNRSVKLSVPADIFGSAENRLDWNYNP